MAILRFVGRIGTDRVGSDCEFEFEVDEAELPRGKQARQEAIEEMAREAAFQLVEWSYEQVENEG